MASTSSLSLAIPSRNPTLSIPAHVECGYGEYIVHRVNADGKAENIDPATFDKIYTKIFLTAIKPAKNPMTAIERNAFFKREIKQLDPTLKVTFVPRILLEFLFIHRCIKEDMAAKSICPFSSKDIWERYLTKEEDWNYFEGSYSDRNKWEKTRDERGCWHAGCYRDRAKVKGASMRQLAHRFNGMLIDELGPKGGAFTFSELQDLTEKEITYLRKHNNKRYHAERLNRYERGATGPTVNFCYEAAYGGHVPADPLGIHDEMHCKIIRNTLALDCSRLAQTSSHIVYRGASRASDLLGKGERRLSFGTGLLAGGVFDGHGAAFHHARKRENDAYAIAIPKENLQDSPIVTPSTDVLSGMLEYGEFFHSSSKVCQSEVQRTDGYLIPRVHGIRYQHASTDKEQMQVAKKYQKVISDQTGEEIGRKFAELVRDSIDLKGHIEMIID
ncbi:MAG: hypothetical protein ACHQUC_08865 [Chlamydiales bacterium]